ncbi:uncharacterized protein LOC124413626 [Diprion similis]|uniref:uncharacterized protein LOC124413626 n=1 Tax=Diprion similis TaxID=362088 RepID=UPI001EF99CF2|nr:uncharacterized protein LOC124413626 [Diprion similis]
MTLMERRHLLYNSHSCQLFLYREEIRKLVPHLAMALQIPTWLDTFHVQKVLRKFQNNESTEISGISITSAAAKGDNYASEIYRVAVDLQRLQEDRKIQEKIPLIVKMALQHGILKEMIADVGFFETELSMISVVLPRIKKILAALTTAQIAPYCLYTQYEEPVHIFMEDLVCKGFRMAVRQKGMDLNHSLLAMQSLALFHASSVALRGKYGAARCVKTSLTLEFSLILIIGRLGL